MLFWNMHFNPKLVFVNSWVEKRMITIIFYYPSLNEFCIFSENLVIVTPITCDLWPFFSGSFQARMAIQRIQRQFCVGRMAIVVFINHSKSLWWSYLMPIRLVLAQFGSVAYVQGHFRSHKITCVFAYNFLQESDRGMRMVLLYWACQDASVDVHIDIQSPLTLKGQIWPSAFGVNK